MEIKRYRRAGAAGRRESGMVEDPQGPFVRVADVQELLKMESRVGPEDAVDVAAALPVPMVLFCPECGTQHIDAPDPAVGWDNPPHKTHYCTECHFHFRPADVPTYGVETTQTHGEFDGKKKKLKVAKPEDKQ